MDAGSKVDWNSSQSQVFLNPRLSDRERQELQALAEQFQKPGHIWIASSGSSKSDNQSLKLIALSKQAFLASGKAVNQHLQSDAKDIWIQTLPRFHVGGLSIETRGHLSGARILNQPQWSAEEFIRLCEEEKATLSALVPTQVFDLLKTGKKAPASLKAIVIGGAALAQDLYEAAIEQGWPLLPSYGMTECCSQIATADLKTWQKKDRRLILLSHVEARTSPQHTLQVRALSMMTGYAQKIDGKAQWFCPLQDGWYQTQDLVEIEGRVLTPLGRGSDFVKILGEGVDLQKLRSRLESLAQAQEPETWQSYHLAAVPDSRLGHRLVLQVLKGASGDKLQALFNQQVAPYERIQEWQTVDDLPWKKKAPGAW